jgi:integrase
VSWKIRYRVPLAPGSTRTKQITETLRGCLSRKAAEGVLATRMSAVFDGSYKPRSSKQPTLLSEYAETFLKAHAGELASLRSYAYSLRLHVVPFLKRKYLHEITTGDCEDYRRHRLGEGAAPATVRNELRYLQSVLKDARKHELCSKDPVADMSFKGIKNSPENAPAPEHVLRLVEAARALSPHDHLRPLFFVLLCTGLRLGSALRLRWENVDYENGCIGTVQKGGTWVWPPMPDLLRVELELWEPRSLNQGSDGWLFPSVTGAEGGTVTPTQIQKAWKKLLKAAKCTGITRHDMRRFMVTRLREIGADDKAIQRVSGHRTAAMVDRYDKRGHASAAAFSEQASDLKSISDMVEKEQKRIEARKKS